MVTQEQIERINALAAKARGPEGLTPEEDAERAALRAAYIAGVKASLTAQLEHTVVVEPDGSRRKLRRRERGQEEN